MWIYEDTARLVSDDKDRPCGKCKLPNRDDDHDACIGELPNVMNACCGHGHGHEKEAYVQFSKDRIGGKEAIEYIENNKEQ